MKKLRLIAMFALTFALVFGAASCKTEAEEDGPWGDSLSEVLKNEELDFKGTWTATDADITTEIDGDVPAGYLPSSGTEPTKKEKIQIMLSNYGLDEKYEGESGTYDLICSLLYFEESVNTYYLDGNYEVAPNATGKMTVSVMINGSRDVIRVEVLYVTNYKVSGKEFTITETEYLEYTKK